MPQLSKALETDFYQLTMAAAYFEAGVEAQATFSLFCRELPPQRGYILAAGLEQALDFLEGFCFTPDDLAYLKSLGRFKPAFLEHLAGLRFSGEVWAIPEGTVCFPQEPLLEVTAPILEAQLVETHLINIINLHSMLASKAARCQQAAQGRSCVDFSLRRTQGMDAGFAAARSSAIAGFAGTSNVAASARLGLVPVGTMAHSFVEAREDEMESFRIFARCFPDHTVLLVDTYHVPTGLERAIEVARELRQAGHKLLGVRVDSGDLAQASRLAREMLDRAGLKDALVVVSGSLDEFAIAELLERGAVVDSFGVGTKMGNSADAPYFDFIYKMVSYRDRPTLKLSPGKETWTAPKQVWRRLDGRGLIAADTLGLRDEGLEGRPLLQPVMRGGRRLEPEPGWRRAQERFQEEAATLPPQCRRLRDPEPLAVEISPGLESLQEQIARTVRANNHH